MDQFDEEAPDTPRVCEACGGRSCTWCTDGYQDLQQQKLWHAFRMRMRHISNTYSLLEDIMNNLVDKLEGLGDPKAKDMAKEGRSLLREWREAEADSPQRRAASVSINIFQRAAVLQLVKSR